MTNDDLSLTPQTIEIFKLLLNNNQMTAKEIAQVLNIYPHAVYRLVDRLVKLGLVMEIKGKPRYFKAESFSEAVEIYTQRHRDWFYNNFTHRTQSVTKRVEVVSMKVLHFHISNQKEVSEDLLSDFQTATESINLIVSGLEVSPEFILETKNATERGVRVRILVQESETVNKDMLENWEKVNIEVKLIPLIDTRLFVIDGGVSYLFSYNPKNTQQTTGVRIAYKPISQLLNTIFYDKWEEAKFLNT